MDIGQWLRGLGLQAYEEAFRDHGVELDVLPHLTADDLKEIGVSAVGHRRKILDAVGELMEARPEAGQKAPDRAERRQLTVMFCDLVGSTALSSSSTRRICRNCCGGLSCSASAISPANTAVLLPNIWAMERSSTSGIPRHMRTTPNGRCARR